MSRDTGNAAYLGDIASMVAFLPGLSNEECTDLQSVLLDAQLFASKQFDFNTQWSSWMHYYRQRLAARGVTEMNVITGDSIMVSSTDDLMQATFKIDRSPAWVRVGEIVQRAFQAMGVYQAAEYYFQSGFDQGRLGSFHIVPCERDESKRILLLLCSLHLSVDDFSAGGRRLLFHFKGGVYTFDSDTYAPHRNDVARYLDGKALSLIRSASI